MSYGSKKLFVLLGITGAILAGTLAYLGGPLIRYFWRAWVGEHLQASVSPDGSHTAELRRQLGMVDFNFVLKIDGKAVYRSSDLCGANYQETLLWDGTGERVLLLLKGRRVFAYDARAKVPLEKGQLGGFDFNGGSDLPELDCGYLKDIEE